MTEIECGCVEDHPMNDNCLVGMVCPECKSQGPFKILVTAIATVHDDGTDDFENVDWDNGASCQCTECGFNGIVDDFRPREETQMRRFEVTLEFRGRVVVPAKKIEDARALAIGLAIAKCGTKANEDGYNLVEVLCASMTEQQEKELEDLPISGSWSLWGSRELAEDGQ